MDDSQISATNGNPEPVDAARLQLLIERLCDQLASGDELTELNRLLAADGLAREFYLRYMQLHSSLQNGAGGLLECSDDASCGCESTAGPSHRGLRWALLFLAASVLVAAIVFQTRSISLHPILSPERGDIARSMDDSTSVARVTQLSDNVIWQNPNESIALQSHVYAGQTLQITHGEILLTYDTGVQLRLLAPVEFVVRASGGNLRRGGLRALVPEKGRGFTIATPNGKVVDLGTEFGVAVDDFGVSEVNVFQGMVDMFPALGNTEAKTIRLTKGEAVQWNRDKLVRLKADPLRLGDGVAVTSGETRDSVHPAIDEDLQRRELNAFNWRTLGDVRAIDGTLELHGRSNPTELPYLVTAREFAPTAGPVTVVCDFRFTSIDPQHDLSFAVLTRSASTCDVGAPEMWRTMRTCLRCSIKSLDDLSTGVMEAAMKLDRSCPITNMQWRGFDRLQLGMPYRLTMTDDGIIVTFTVSMRDDPSISKTVVCRSLFRGKENYIALEGPAAGTVAVDHIQVFQNTASELIADDESVGGAGDASKAIGEAAVVQALDVMAPTDGQLIVRDNFDGHALDDKIWTTLGEVSMAGGRVRLGSPNDQEHINTWMSRPYLLTRESYAPADGTLTILGTAEFDTNFLNEYGGSFAVMTRADNRLGNGPGWEYSVLRYGVRANFWPAAWGQEHSLEIHEKPSPSTVSLLVAEGLQINPAARKYLFKIVDDGERATLTIQDVQNASISKTVSAATNPALRSGFIGFEGCWGCPVWLDDVRIYRAAHDQ